MIPHFKKGDFNKLLIPIPDRRIQEFIGSVYMALVDKIELNRRMNETLEAMARAIFRDWFVEFGPTRAKTEGRAPYLTPDIWSLFPDRLDGEGMPVGWTLGSLADFASLNPESWSRANYPDTVEYVDLSNTKWGTIETVTPFTSAAAPSRAQRILRQGDTIVGTVRPGNGSYAFVSQQGLTGSTGFAVLRPSRKIFREVVYLSATSKDNIDRLSHLADGGAYPAVRPELVAATALINAPSVVFSEFSATVSSLIDRVEANKQENRALAATRDLLLPKLMSGEIRVRDAEKAVEATQ
jgi:type I restriction enzyme S subunit